jgi:transcriptional regulator with GAF, ATPase, and Fis domain
LVDRVYFDGHDGPLCFTEELSLLAENRLDGVPSLKLVDVEREHIRRVLALCGGKVGGPGGAAELLGMPRTTLLSLMGRLGLR